MARLEDDDLDAVADSLDEEASSIETLIRKMRTLSETPSHIRDLEGIAERIREEASKLRASEEGG